MGFLVAILFYFEYQKEIRQYEERLFTKMRLCSMDLNCPKFQIDFVVKQEGITTYRLYKKDQNLQAFFPISRSSQHLLAITLPKNAYTEALFKIKKTLLIQFFSFLIVVALLSILFSWYALSPLRNALHLTQEFVKDILHDFNTPLSTMRLNGAMLEKEFPHNKKIARIQQSISTILDLEKNLRLYLDNHSFAKEHFSLKTLLQERIHFIAEQKEIVWKVALQEQEVYTHKDGMTRIIDNLLSNAVKYTPKSGAKIEVYLQDGKLVIADNGKGIENPKKIFERFYKEQDRGMGIGLHIVKKLCDRMGISIEVYSVVGKGSRFLLDLRGIIS